MFKKSLLPVAAAAALFTSAAPVNALEGPRDANDVLDAVIMWLPNLAMNILDTFTLEAGSGATFKLGVKATRACHIGWAYAEKKPTFVWGPNHQFGGCLEEGYQSSFFCFTRDTLSRPAEYTSRSVKGYEYNLSGIPLPTESVYDFFTGQRNYWAIGVYGGLFVDGALDVNPDEILDLVAGVFFIDLKGNALSTSDFTGKALGN